MSSDAIYILFLFLFVCYIFKVYFLKGTRVEAQRKPYYYFI